MYRNFEDMERMDHLDDERLRLFVENRELKKKLERKKYKIQDLKERVEELTKALSQTGLSVNDAEQVQYGEEEIFDDEQDNHPRPMPKKLIVELKIADYEPMGDIGRTTRIRRDRLDDEDENKPKIVHLQYCGSPDEYWYWQGIDRKQREVKWV